MVQAPVSFNQSLRARMGLKMSEVAAKWISDKNSPAPQLTDYGGFIACKSMIDDYPICG
jgi:hypothetical protein